MKVLIGLIFLVSHVGFGSIQNWTWGLGHNSTLTTYNSTLLAHDYHISNFEIEFNAETQALEIIAKIFIDDMEDGIAASGVEEKLYLCTDREIEAGDDYIYQYLTDRFKIKVNGKDVNFNFIGKEVGEELVSMYCYLEVENIDNVDEVTISNDMLMEVFDDQINIVKLVSKSTKKRGFMMLKKGAHSDTANL